MARRILIIVAVLAGAVLLVLLTLPFWLGAALESVAARFGATFDSYQRVGYGRFALHDVTYRSPTVHATAERVEAASPLAWAWSRVTGNGAAVEVGRWSVTMTPASADTPKPEEPAGAPSGWMPLRNQLREIVAQVEPWVSRASLGSGTITSPALSATVVSANWQNRVLSLNDLALQGRVIDATLAVPADADVIRLEARTQTEEAALAVMSREDAVTGEAAWWGEPATFTARFPAQGWMPDSAELSARDWEIPAERAQLGELYDQLRATAEIRWKQGRFDFEVAANSTSLPGEGAVPPVDIALQGEGDLNAVTVEQFHAEMPGATANLSVPVTITREGEIRDRPARFVTRVDLAQLPWLEATGTVSGELEVTGNAIAGTPPPVEFRIEATDVSAQEVALRTASAHGRLRWPRIDVTAATLTGPSGETVRASGGWDIKAQEAHEVTLEGEVRHASVARWLPENMRFEAVHVSATADGPLDEISHQGRLRIDNAQAATSRELDLALQWQGTGRKADEFNARIEAGDSHLEAAGAVDLESVRLTRLEFAPAEVAPLQLSETATLQWKPQLRLDGLTLRNAQSEVHASLVWGNSGRVALAVRDVPSTWFADFVTLPGPPWTADSVAVTGSWDDGPVTFEAVADASAVLRERHEVGATLHLRGDGKRTELVALRAREDGVPVLSASGSAPVTFAPGGEPAVRIDESGQVELSLRTLENPAFWEEVGRVAGVTLESPRLTADLSGTWRAPAGELRAEVGRVALRREDAKPLPPVEDLRLALHADRGEVILDELAFQVQDQPVRASGRMPLPEQDWSELTEAPLQYLDRIEFQIAIPSAQIAAFEELLPEAVLPNGAVEMDLALRDGELGGSVRLRDAGTRPVGALGALHEIEANVRFDGSTVYLDPITARLSGETVRIQGSVALPPLKQLAAEAREPDFELRPEYEVTLQANNIPLVRQVGTLVRADIDLELTTPPDAAPLVQGRVRLRDSLFLQDVRGLIPSGTRSKSERPPYFAVEIPPFSDWRIDVQVSGDEFMRLRTTLFTGVASADFQLGGTLGEPTLLGEATIDRGNVRFPFATFEVEEGRVALTEAQPHEPQLYFTAATRRFEYDLLMEVTGSASSPSVTFESTPPLDRAEVLLMVMAGVVPSDEINVTQQQRATRLGAYLGRSLLSNFGDASDTSRLTITSGEDISDQGRETYELEYALDPKWSLTAEYDEYDTQTFGLKWQALARGGSQRGSGSGLGSGDTESLDGEGSGGRGGDESAARNAPGGTGDGGQAGGDANDETSDEEEPEPAKLNVDGLGWFSDLTMAASLKRLLGEDHDAVLDPHTIEDALFLLLSAVREDGYLRPTVKVDVVNTDGSRHQFSVDTRLTTTIPRDVRARSVTFDVARGQHYGFDDLHIEGLEAIEPEAARAYFVASRGLFRSQQARTFTPNRLKQGVASLEAALRERGYADATVTASEPAIDHASGEVDVTIAVDEGVSWQIASVDVRGEIEGLGAAEATQEYLGEPWTESAEQDLAAELRRRHLEAGYADARVRVSHEVRSDGPGGRNVQVLAEVEPGPQVRVGEVRFEGNVKTKDSILQRRVQFEPGDPLNPLDVQQARHRIARLGVFEDVDVAYDPEGAAERDIVFDLEPGRRLVLNLLAGYNTYEQLRAGVEFRQFNVWGRAHQTRGLLVQSFKSSQAEYTYTVPELFGENVHGSARLFGLQREEVAFLRQEYGARFTIDTPLRFLGANLTAGYTFEVLRNRESQLETRTLDPGQVEVASVEAGLVRDRRDNPLLPRDGYRWYGRVESASELLGGEAEYQRLEIGGTYHQPWGVGRWWHFALAHGVVTTFGSDDSKLPVNRRFFPGGDGSIRGYELGEAAPRGVDGRFVGAKSYLGGTVEFEQAIVGDWSAVLFADALGSSRRLGGYPFDEVLLSVGLGVRYQTLIGPVRAEYGYNVERRERDPRGTFLLSIGFPF